jgi:hypothetical protein
MFRFLMHMARRLRRQAGDRPTGPEVNQQREPNPNRFATLGPGPLGVRLPAAPQRPGEGTGSASCGDKPG